MTKEVVPTGIKGLDEALGGGLPARSCVLLLTCPRVEARLFCLEFLYRGILRREPALMVTMDYSPEDLKRMALDYGILLARGEQQGLLKWVDGYSLNIKRDVRDTESIRRIGGSIALPDLAVSINEFQQSFVVSGAKLYRFVFDSLSTLFIYNDPNAIYRFLRVIIPRVRASGGVGILTLGAKMHEERIVMTLRYMTDGALEIDEELRLRVLSLPHPAHKERVRLKLTNRGFLAEEE